MKQEAAQELICGQGHEPFLVAVRGIAPAEGDVATGESDQPGVRDADAMSVDAEIAQHMLRATEGALGVSELIEPRQHGPEEAGFTEIVRLIGATRERAMQAVNTALIDLYWQIGEIISRRGAAAQ